MNGEDLTTLIQHSVIDSEIEVERITKDEFIVHLPNSLALCWISNIFGNDRQLILSK